MLAFYRFFVFVFASSKNNIDEKLVTVQSQSAAKIDKQQEGRVEGSDVCVSNQGV